MRGEVVAGVAERADPELAVEIDARVGVEAGGASLAAHRVVGDHGHVREDLTRGHHRAERDDAFRRLDLAVGPDVPARAGARDSPRRAGVRMKDLSRATAGGGSGRRARARVRGNRSRSTAREMLKARGRDAGVAHHDSRTPSTASRAPQSGVCIARSTPRTVVARGSPVASRRSCACGRSERARERESPRFPRANVTGRALRSCSDARDRVPRARAARTGRCWPRRRFRLREAHKRNFLCTAIRRDVLIS